MADTLTPEDSLATDGDPTPRHPKLSGKAAVAVAAVAGLMVGAAASGIYAESVTIPRWKDALTAVSAERDSARDGQKKAADRNAAMEDLANASKERAETAEQKLSAAEATFAEREAKVAERETAVQAREEAVTKTEDAIAAATITEGTWSVGRDIQPGTYVTKEPVTGSCYWAIYRGGTNGGDIVDNDIVKGGRPTVTLKAGQDFRTSRCGSWVPA